VSTATAGPSRHDSKWRLLADVLAVKLLLWAALGGRLRDVEFQELSENEHLFFGDRYQRLAKLYEARRRADKTTWDRQRAQDHFDATSDGPPYAAAMALPRPRPYLRIKAVASNSTNVT
jgi:hypothetical protein